MCPTLFHIPAEIAGCPVFGGGLLLAFWAVASVAWLAWLARRQGFNADTWSYVPILLIVGAVVGWVLPALCDKTLDEKTLNIKLIGLPIRGYGVMMLLAVLSGTVLAVRRSRRLGWNPDMAYSLVFWMIVPGIVGARAFYIIEYWDKYWQTYTDPEGGFWRFLGDVVNLARGGLVVYGSFIGGMIGLLWFVRRNRLHWLVVGDLMAPSMMLGLAIGRIGCLLNGCCFGAVCDHGWAITFPADPPFSYSPAYAAQVERGQMYGFLLSDHAESPPRVLAVTPGSPADRAGLKKDDFLTAVNDYKLPVEQDSSQGKSLTSRLNHVNDYKLPVEQDSGPTGAAHKALTEAFNLGQPLRLKVANRPAVTIPAMVKRPRRSLPVQPTQPLSTIDALLLCFLLLAYDPFRRRDGELFALMLSIYPVSRFCIEGLRSDEATVFGTGMSISQNVSVLLLIVAAALWFYILRRPLKIKNTTCPTTKSGSQSRPNP